MIKIKNLRDKAWLFLKLKVFKIKESESVYGVSYVCKCILFPIMAYRNKYINDIFLEEERNCNENNQDNL